MQVRNCVVFLLLTAMLMTTAFGGRLAAQEEETPLLTIGHAASIFSRVLDEERPLLVDLPNAYALTQTRYPVLYLLDGLANFHHATATVDFLSRTGRIPEMIIVGIPNIARTRDLTPTAVEDRELSGGADNFLEFIKDELIPYVDERYRTQPYRALFGHSLGGTFTVYSLFTEPDLFGGYIAASPYLDYDEGHVIDLAEQKLASEDPPKKALYVTLGNEPDYVDALDRFSKVLKGSGDGGLNWEYVSMENDEHMSTPLKSLYQGLEMIFSGWSYPGDLADADIPAIEAHYEGLSDEFGYEILIPEGLLNQIGYLLLSREQFDEAIAAFKLNIDNYPESANVYDSLGEGYEAMNQLSLARLNYQAAYERGQKIGDPNTYIYKQHLDDLVARLSEFD